MILLWTETLAISLLGGFSFYVLQLPLPWMLGPMTAALIGRFIFKRSMCWSSLLRNLGLAILGAMIGFSFTPETAKHIIYHLPWMTFSTLILFLYSLLAGYFISKRTGIDLKTCLVGNMPGGFAQMIVLGSEITGADITTVAFLQTIRLLSVIFIVPFMVVHGWVGAAPVDMLTVLSVSSAVENQPIGIVNWLLYIVVAIVGAEFCKHRHLPTPYMVGPLLAVAGLVLSGLQAPHLSGLVIVGAQVSVGIFIGSSIGAAKSTKWQIVLPYALVSSVGLVVCSLGIAYVLTLVQPINIITAFLSAAPGGIAEMGVTAAAVRADLTLVASYQIFRLLFILFIVPPLLKYWLADNKIKDSN